MSPTSTEPLTIEERNWLRANAILPPLFAIPIALVMAAVLVFIERRFDHPAVTVFAAIAGLLLLLVLAAVALHVWNNVRDVREDALVARAKLVGKRSTGRSPRTFYATLDGVGSLIVMGEVYETLALDRIYRVKYSRRTKRCWSTTAF